MIFLKLLNAFLNNAIAGAVVGGLLVYFCTGYREHKKERLQLFKTLMATRATCLSPEHVNALNRIDLEFYGKKYKNVIDAWHLYLAHLNTLSSDQSWNGKRLELLLELLYAMSISLGYKFNKAHLQTIIYCPSFHGELEERYLAIHKGVADIIDGERHINIKIIK